MKIKEERKKVVEYGKKLIESGLTTGTGGNLSIYNADKGLMAISPSGMDYFEIEVEDVLVMDLKGNIIEGNKKPSSEYAMHSIFYRNREDVRAVVHTHSIYSTTIATLNWEIEPVHYLVAFAGKKVPCADYATYGTEKLAENAYSAMQDEYNATLLANHGLLAVGNNMATAFATAEEIEFCAEVLYRTKAIGDPVVLPEEEMELMMEKFKSYGQR
ncbi:MAG: L-fuculose-phosphate aldolase [Halanaerobiales bacterium]